MSLVLRRLTDESWLEAAIRVAKRHGLSTEVKETYDSLVSSGREEDQAAFEACYEWDVLSYEPDSKPDSE